MKFNEFVLKYKRILFISFAAAISFLLLCLIGFYFWLNYHTMAQVGDFKITRKVVLDNIGKNKDYVLSVKGKDANLEAEVYKIVLEEKATEYESAKRGVKVTDAELNTEIQTIATDGDVESYYKMVAVSYGWNKAEANSQVRNRMIREKLESTIVQGYNVQSFFVRDTTEPKQGETAEQIKTTALSLAAKARLDAISGKSLQQIRDDITAASPLTWSGDMSHGTSEVPGINASNEAQKLANGKYWPAIQKLTKKGDVTEVIDATKEGGLYVFWQLDSKTAGTYNNMEEFYQSFQSKSAITTLLLKVTPAAYAACSNYINNIVANDSSKIADFRVTYFEIKVRDASTHAVITTRPNAHVVTSNVEPADGHCDSSWCNMDQDDILGTNGQATMYNSCCQFTYAVSIEGLTGYAYVHTHRQGVTEAALTTAYPPHFNGVNGVNNMYGQMDYNPIVSTITPSADTGCSISPNTTQTVSYGGTQGFTGSASNGYNFAGFSVDGGATTPGTPYNFSNVITSHTIVAKCTFVVTYTIYPMADAGCTISPSTAKTVASGGTSTFSVTVSNGYSFNYFLLDNMATHVAPTGPNSYTFTNVTANRNIWARCSVNATSATLNVVANPPAGGTVGGGGSFNTTSSSQNYNATATPNAGYSLSWTSTTGTACSSGSFAARSTETRNCTANFTPNAPITYRLSTSVASGEGSISGAGTYNSGSTAYPVANPSGGWGFSSWTGDCAGQGASASVYMNGNKNCSANFSQTTYTLSTSVASGSGTVSGAGTYNSGATAYPVANPSGGWGFSSWTGDCAGQGASASVYMNGNKSCSANFSQTTYTLSTSVASGSGTVSGAGTYNSGATAYPVANPSGGWLMSAWSGNCSGQGASASVVMNGDKNCIATFTKINNILEVHLETPAAATVYTTSTHGGTADVSLAAHATDADTDETIVMQISYQIAGGGDTWMKSQSMTGVTGVIGAYSVNLPAGTYYWVARAVTNNPEDGTQTTSIRTLTIQDLPATPSLSCAVVPLAGSSPAVIKVDYTVTDGNGGTVSVNMGDGSPLLTSGSPVYHTYETAGVFNVTVTYSNTADMSQCPVRKVTVKDPTSGTGTEVAP